MDIKIATIGERGTTWQDVTIDEDEDEEEETMLTEEEGMERYDAILDENGPIEVGGGSFYPSDILKNCDDTRYRKGFSDFADTLACCGEPVEGWV